METIYLCIIIFLFVLAVFDLIVGVSNDAVNFLNSAVGAKAASFKTILFIAGIGIFIGASLSNGMMDIARHGIYQPEHFYFAEIMCILLAVMLTDVVLLDVFNSMGMPTSTTVSLVFELLGGTFALSLIKVRNSDTLGLGDLINTDKALSVIMAIFVSVAIAFFFGMLVQWLARVIFTFNYTKKMKYSIALFGGVAATSIIYFMLIKGLKDSSFMTPENKQWIQDNTWMLISVFFVFFTILMQILHWLKINVFKVVVLMGTFALALAFAGNDLVNFIGGWFITAGAAFTICFFVALVLHFGGNISIIALIALAAFILIRSQVMYKKRKAKEQGNETLKQLMQTSDSEEALQLMRKHTREELCKVLEYAETNFELTVTSFIHENLRGLRRAMGSTKFEKQLVKQMKRTGTVAMCRLDNNTVLEKGLYYYQGNDFASELVYSISRLCEPCLEHIDNNFNPLDAIQKGEFSDVSEDITYLIQQCRKKMENNEYNDMEEEVRRANDLNGQLSLLKRKELQRIQSQAGSIRVSMVYLTMVQEAQNVVTYTINLMKVSRKFQVETEMP